jgi:3-mercaptopyruvate sulfurtransferase SseA
MRSRCAGSWTSQARPRSWTCGGRSVTPAAVITTGRGHIPAAVYVDLDTQLAAPPDPVAGRHPLPDVPSLQEAARQWGLRAGRPVVVYDNNGGQAAARAWWLLRWAGLGRVRILDGALNAWTRAGFDLEAGDYQAARGDVILDAGHLPVLTADDAAAVARDGVLLDARASERYRGDVEPVDSQAGHIPGAVSAPTSGHLTADGTFAAPETRRIHQRHPHDPDHRSDGRRPEIRIRRRLHAPFRARARRRRLRLDARRLRLAERRLGADRPVRRQQLRAHQADGRAPSRLRLSHPGREGVRRH